MTTLKNNADNPEKYRNRGLDTKAEEDSRISISLVDIDGAIMKYMEEVIQPFVVQDELKVTVPIFTCSIEPSVLHHATFEFCFKTPLTIRHTAKRPR